MVSHLSSVQNNISYMSFRTNISTHVMIMITNLAVSVALRYNDLQLSFCRVYIRVPLIARFMGPTWDPSGALQDPVGPHVGPMNFATWGGFGTRTSTCRQVWHSHILHELRILFKVSQQPLPQKCFGIVSNAIGIFIILKHTPHHIG